MPQAFIQYYNVTRLPSAVFTTGHATSEISIRFPYHQATCPAHITWNYLVPKPLLKHSTSHTGTIWMLLNKNVAFNQNTVTQGETPMHRLICVAVPSSLSLSHHKPVPLSIHNITALLADDYPQLALHIIALLADDIHHTLVTAWPDPHSYRSRIYMSCITQTPPGL